MGRRHAVDVGVEQQPSRYAIAQPTTEAGQPSRYAIQAGAPTVRPLTEAEHALTSLKRGADRAEEMRAAIVRLYAQVQQQEAWLNDPATPDDALWDQRRSIADARWQELEQTIGNLSGWVAIHLAEAERVPAGPQRDRIRGYVERIYAVEGWLESGVRGWVQYPNGDDPIPF